MIFNNHPNLSGFPFTVLKEREMVPRSVPIEDVGHVSISPNPIWGHVTVSVFDSEVPLNSAVDWSLVTNIHSSLGDSNALRWEFHVISMLRHTGHD
ncbi:unnamed protein product [Fusarium graminearum]|nr:unnamed protein product [Fusarium graminearum]